MKSMRLGGGGDVTSMKKKKYIQIFFEIPEGERSLGRSWEERLGEGVDWIHLAQNKVQW